MGSPSLVDNGRHRGRARLSVGMPQGKLPVPSARRHEFSWQTRAQRVSASRRRRRRERLRSRWEPTARPGAGRQTSLGHGGTITRAQGEAFRELPRLHVFRGPRTKRTPQTQNRGARLPRTPACCPRDPSLVQRNAGLGTNSFTACRPRLWACCSRAAPDHPSGQPAKCISGPFPSQGGAFWRPLSSQRSTHPGSQRGGGRSALRPITHDNRPSR
jgi:hypothetical protein